MKRLLTTAVAAVFALGLGLSAASPAVAENPSAQVVVTGVQTLPGKVRFFAAARDLPPGVTLSEKTLSVSADGVAMPATVTTISGTGSNPGQVTTRAVVLAFDISGSMAGPPMEAAREAALNYAKDLPADIALGLVTFADKANKVVEPTTDREPFINAVKGLNAAGGTAVYDGMRMAGDMLGAHKEYTERRVVVLSDGADTNSTAKPADVAKDLGAAKARMDVVAFGPQAGGPEITALVTVSGGRMVPAADAAALRTAFKDLAGTLSAPVEVNVTVPASLAGKSTTMTVSVNAQGRQVTAATTPVQLREDVSMGGPLKSAHVWLLPKWLMIVSMVGIGGAVLMMVYLLMLFAPSRSKVRRRLRHIEGFTSEHGAKALAEEQRGSAVVRAALEISEKAVQSKGNQNKVEAELDRAGINLRANEWLLIRALTTAGGAVAMSFIMPWYFGMIFGGVLGFAGPGLYRKLRAARRAKKFTDLLPDALQLMVSALRSGFSLPQAIDALVREGAEPVSSEFGRAPSEIRIGAELEEALERCAQRNGSRDLAWLVMAIRIQHEVGGSLSEVMETAVETMRERGRLARHVRALSAEGRLSAYVLIGLPVVLAGYMFAVRRTYLEPLYTQPLGILMLISAVVMLGVGSFWMMRVVKVQV